MRLSGILDMVLSTTSDEQAVLSSHDSRSLIFVEVKKEAGVAQAIFQCGAALFALQKMHLISEKESLFGVVADKSEWRLLCLQGRNFNVSPRIPLYLDNSNLVFVEQFADVLKRMTKLIVSVWSQPQPL